MINTIFILTGRSVERGGGGFFEVTKMFVEQICLPTNFFSDEVFRISAERKGVGRKIPF